MRENVCYRLAVGVACLLFVSSVVTFGTMKATAQLTGIADTPWPMFRHDLRHTGLSPYDTSENTGQLKWAFTTGDIVSSSVAIGPDGTLYVGSRDNNLYALNPAGALKWAFAAGGEVNSAPAVAADGTIYVGSDDWYLYAIKPDGTLKWSYQTGGEVRSSPAVDADGIVYFGSVDGTFYALYPSGTLKWSYPTHYQIYSSPAIGTDGTIYVGSSNGFFYAFFPSGTLRWFFNTGAGDLIGSSPAIASDGTIYFCAYTTNIYALHPDGTLKWSYHPGNYLIDSPAVGADGTVYVGTWFITSNYGLIALYPDGRLKWQFPTSFGISGSSPAVGADGTIFVLSFDGNLYAVNQDGTLRWIFATTGWVSDSSPAIDADGTVYVGSGDNKLYAINDKIVKEGGIEWRWDGNAFIHGVFAKDVDHLPDNKVEIITVGDAYVGQQSTLRQVGELSIWHWDNRNLQLIAHSFYPPAQGEASFRAVYAVNLDNLNTPDQIIVAGYYGTQFVHNPMICTVTWNGYSLSPWNCLVINYLGLFNSVHAADIVSGSSLEVVAAGQVYPQGYSQGYLAMFYWPGGALQFAREVKWAIGSDAGVNSVYAADVDSRYPGIEIMTAGYTHLLGPYPKQGELIEWRYDPIIGFISSTADSWVWNTKGGGTEALSVYAADVGGPNSAAEIIVCGYSNDGAQDWGELQVFNTPISVPGEPLDSKLWKDSGGNRCNSVHAGDVDNDGFPEIVTVGYSILSGYMNGEIMMWRFEAGTLNLLALKHWQAYMMVKSPYLDVIVNSVYVKEVDADGYVEMLTGGQIRPNDGQQNYWSAQLRIFHDP